MEEGGATSESARIATWTTHTFARPRRMDPLEAAVDRAMIVESCRQLLRLTVPADWLKVEWNYRMNWTATKIVEHCRQLSINIALSADAFTAREQWPITIAGGWAANCHWMPMTQGLDVSTVGQIVIFLKHIKKPWLFFISIKIKTFVLLFFFAQQNFWSIETWKPKIYS